MKAITILGPNDIRMVEIEKPKPGPEELLIKVAFCGICGTDLAILSGDISFVKSGLIRYPVRIGHEWSGIVEDFGDKVKGFGKGDRVVADNGVTCGTCECCLAKRYDFCRDMRSVGTVNTWDGAFAEYMVIPDRHVFRLPDNVTLEEAALIEPATIAKSGIEHIGVAPESCILVSGTGPIGLSTVALLKNAGFKTIILSGRKQGKLEIGKAMGADIVINVIKEDIKSFIFEMTSGIGVDAIIETSGNISSINPCLDILKPKGILALVGFYETNLGDFNVDKLVINAIQIKGIVGEFGYIPGIIGMISTQGLDLKPMITHRFKFAEAVDAIRTAGGINDTRVKMMVEM